MAPNKRPRRLSIVDQPRLTALLDYLQNPRSTQAETAASIGLTQHHFSKLRGGKLRSVTAKTYALLHERLPSYRHTELERAFASGDAAILRSRYGYWLARETRRLQLGATGRLAKAGDGFATQSGTSKRGRAGGREGELRTLWGIADNQTSGLLTQFGHWLGTRGHTEERVEFSIFRILVPLIDAPNAGFVERHWHELSKQELKDFIKAGIKRESILLDRAADAQRVQKISMLNDSEFLARFGGENMLGRATKK